MASAVCTAAAVASKPTRSRATSMQGAEAERVAEVGASAEADLKDHSKITLRSESNGPNAHCAPSPLRSSRCWCCTCWTKASSGKVLSRAPSRDVGRGQGLRSTYNGCTEAPRHGILSKQLLKRLQSGKA